ncbi:ribonuclease BN [Streptomyces sp. V4-01]|uniref:Ribonuclease BN n=1 Tax=Actinacidiphila polyblastidii TaxID=3110430 RepID=A0ABU7PG91_9ACTN|nr:ribonuclease BN [Streptomyces sp. V4-01]
MWDVREAWRRSVAGRIRRQSAELELMHRAMGFAALGMVTLMPLLIVVAAAAPYRRAGFEQWIVDGMGLSATPAAAVRDLFATPGRVISTTSAVSLASLAFFGLSFAASVETVYLRVWDLPPAPWHGAWRRAVWLAALTGYLFAEAQSGDVLRSGWAASAVRVPLTLAAGTAFFWWGQSFLLGHRVPARPMLTGALCTMAGLVGLRVFSVLVLSRMTVSNALTYGPVGTIVMVQCWLIGVGFVVFGGALVGRQLHHRTVARDAPSPAGTPSPPRLPAQQAGSGDRHPPPGRVPGREGEEPGSERR